MMISEMIETNAYLHAQTGGRVPDGGALATIDGTNDPLYLLDDALGSVRGVTNGAGNLDGTADYAVYGEVRASSGVSTLFRFTGEQHDAETGFTYLRARYANPALGRFISADTVQPNAPGTQGYNLHAYVANNPTTWVDPSGHSISTNATIAAGIAAGLAWFYQPQIIAASHACMVAMPGCTAALTNSWTLARRGPVSLVFALGGAGITIATCYLSGLCGGAAATLGDAVRDYSSTGPSDQTWDRTNVRDALQTWPKAQDVPAPVVPSCGVTPPIILDPITFSLHIWKGHGPSGKPWHGRFRDDSPGVVYAQIVGAANLATGWQVDRGDCRTHVFYPGIGYADFSRQQDSNCLSIVTKGAVGPPWFIGSAYPVTDRNCGM